MVEHALIPKSDCHSERLVTLTAQNNQLDFTYYQGQSLTDHKPSSVTIPAMSYTTKGSAFLEQNDYYQSENHCYGNRTFEDRSPFIS